jgi:thiol-disulfide isomerase/thioredoxin
MKNIISILILVLFSFTSSQAQQHTIEPPYKRFPEYPPVKLLLADSAHYFTKDDLPKKKPIWLMMFNPNCSHCQHETEEMVSNMDDFKDIQIVMVTSMPLDSMRAFTKKYQLQGYKNVVVGQDTHYFLFDYFQNKNLPFNAFYDKKKQLITVFQGGATINAIKEIFKD